MTTKISKVLTVLVTVLSLGFLGATAVSSIARTNWKEKAAEFPEKKAQEYDAEIRLLNEQRDIYVQQLSRVASEIQTDEKAMIDRAATLKKYSQAVEEQDRQLRELNTTTAQSAQEQLDIDKMRREEIQRLQAQHEELVSQKEAAQAEVRRLRDLLYQSRGVLERAERRQNALQEELGRPLSAPYDPSVDVQPPTRTGAPAKGIVPARIPQPAEEDAAETTAGDDTEMPAESETTEEEMPADEMPADEMPAEEVPAEGEESAPSDAAAEESVESGDEAEETESADSVETTER